MRLYSFHGLFLVFFISLAAWSDGPVQASLSSQEVVAGQSFSLTISVSGQDVSEPDVQPLAQTGLEIGRPSQSSSTQISMINGQTTMVQTKSWRYPLRAKEVGAISIPRIAVTVDGKQYFTNPMFLKVSKELPRQNAGRAQSSGRNNGSIGLEDAAFVESAVDHDEVYQGEVVRLTLRFYLLDDLGIGLDGPNTLPLPETQGFYSGAQAQQTIRENRNGRSYRVTEVTIPLFPTQSGPLTIGSWDWQATVYWPNPRGFGNLSAQRDFHTTPISINVRPLPAAPDAFTGAVGKYRFKSDFPNAPLTQGVPVRWIISVSGEGNLDAVGAPSMPAIAWAHVSGPEIDVQAGDNGEQSKIFSYTVTPLEKGEQKLPALSFAFFSPILKNYKTETAPERTVTVQASTESTELVTAGGSQGAKAGKVELLNDGLAPIITETPAFHVPPSPLSMGLVYGGIILTPPLLFAGYFLWMRHRRRLSGDRRYARKYQALAKCRALLNKAVGSEDPSERIYRAVTGFISDLLDAQEGGLTSAEIQKMLSERSLEADLVDKVTALLRACERARYTGYAPDKEEVVSLSEAANSLVTEIREELNKRIKQ